MQLRAQHTTLVLDIYMLKQHKTQREKKNKKEKKQNIFSHSKAVKWAELRMGAKQGEPKMNSCRKSQNIAWISIK